MNDSQKIVIKPAEVAETTPFRVRPEAFLIAGFVVISGYLTTFDATRIEIHGVVTYTHPNIWPFSPGTLGMEFDLVAIACVLFVAMASATAFFYLQWRRGFYSLKAFLGLMIVAGCAFSVLSLPDNEVLADSLAKDLLAIPFIIGAISLIFVVLHLLIKAIFRSPYSRTRLLDRP